jgi:hypothetical protein
MAGFPGPVGFAAFAGVKFGGYCLAGVALKKIQPSIDAGAVRIAAARTGIGIAAGLLWLGFLQIGATIFENKAAFLDQYGQFLAYGLLALMRFLVWCLVIGLFTRRVKIPTARFYMLALAGAAWSCLLDVPGVALAMFSPGSIPIC